MTDLPILRLIAAAPAERLVRLIVRLAPPREDYWTRTGRLRARVCRLALDQLAIRELLPHIYGRW